MNLRLYMVISGLLLMVQALSQPSGSKPMQNQKNHLYHACIFSFDYASNSNVLGIVSTETRQPSFSPSIAYLSPWGADLSLQGSIIGNSDDSLENYTSELDLVLGYTIKPFKNLTLYPSYTHYFYSSNSGALNSMFTDDIRIDADYSYKFFSLGISAGYFLGKQSTFYLTTYNYYSISPERFLSRKGSLILQPGIDANFGSYEYLNLYYVDKLKENRWIYTYLLYNFPAIRRYVLHEMYKNPEQTREEVLDKYLEEKAEDNFKLTSISLNMPIYYMIGNFGINLGIYAFIPIKQPDYLTEEVQFFFNFGLSYDLTFK